VVVVAVAAGDQDLFGTSQENRFAPSKGADGSTLLPR